MCRNLMSIAELYFFEELSKKDKSIADTFLLFLCIDKKTIRKSKSLELLLEPSHKIHKSISLEDLGEKYMTI